MILADFQIEELVGTSQLISPFEVEKLSNCRYNLRAGKAFSPESGDELVVGNVENNRRLRAWAIKPSETLVIMTLEAVKIPSNLMATYGQLNRMAQQGLLLINASIVEPGYEGPLSCFLVNFSKETVFISPDDEVAKISFHMLAFPPKRLKPSVIKSADYERSLSTSASRYPASFIDISGVQERVTDHVSKGLDRSLKFGGVAIAFLLLWSALEPITSKYLWEKIGVASTTQKEEINKLRTDLEQARAELDKANAELKAQQQQQEIDRLKQALNRKVPQPGRQ